MMVPVGSVHSSLWESPLLWGVFFKLLLNFGKVVKLFKTQT